MGRPHPRSGLRQQLRLHDRDEGSEQPESPGLRLRRPVLRRPDLEAHQIIPLLPKTEPRDVFSRGIFLRVRHLESRHETVTASDEGASAFDAERFERSAYDLERQRDPTWN